MEMVDMYIRRFGFSGPKSRSVNICSASKSWMIFDVGFFDFEKMTFLDIFDVYLIVFVMFNQYLLDFDLQNGANGLAGSACQKKPPPGAAWSGHAAHWPPLEQLTCSRPSLSR